MLNELLFLPLLEEQHIRLPTHIERIAFGKIASKLIQFLLPLSFFLVFEIARGVMEGCHLDMGEVSLPELLQHLRVWGV